MPNKPTYEALEERVRILERSYLELKQAEEVLRESEELFRNLFEDHAAVQLIIDPVSGNIIDANDAAVEFYGWARKKLQQMRVQDINILSPEEIKQEMEKARTHKRVHFEFRHRLADGSIRDVEVFSSNIEAKGKEFLHSVIHDQTARKKAEQALRESEEIFKSFMENSPIYIFFKDENIKAIRLSKNYEQMIGRPLNEILGKTMDELFPSELAKKMVADDKKILNEGKLVIVEEQFDGRNYSTTKFPIVIDPQTIYLAGYTIDITERKRAETALRRSHQMFLTVLDGIDASVYVADMHSHEILFMNKHMIDAFGGDLTGRICYEAFRCQTEPCGHCTNEGLLDADGRPTGVCVWETKNPLTGKWYINHDRAIQWLDGRIVRLQIASDVTLIKEMEQEHNRIGEQLKQAQKMESVGRLAGGVAHDFNNMLGAILGYSELGMLAVSAADPIHGILKDIQKAAQRSAELTRQLLAFARKQTVTPLVLDLNETVGGMLSMLRQLIGENIDLSWLPAKDLSPVRMDPSQIEQILANLCVNARDAIHDTGKISVETGIVTLDEIYCASHVGFVPGTYMLLAVSDTGCGMDAKTRSHLFEPFFTTKAVGKGTGLGLATVYGMVKQNNGFIDVCSEPGQGTTFNIYLPPYTAETGCTAKMNAEQPAARGHETILLVEDELMILEMTKTMLERQGYTVNAAATPGEAIHLAREHAGEIHLLMTDVVMPEMNGRDLAKNLLSLYPNLKRIFMSGYTADVIAHHGVLDEGVQFIQKPFSMQALAAKVRDVLDETK